MARRAAPGPLAVVTATVLSGLFALPASSAAAAAPFCTGSAGTGASTITTSDGQVHTYYWRTPSTPPPSGGRPVLIWMHGDGGDGSAMAPEYWSSTDPDGALIITPSGTNLTWTHAAADLPGQSQDSLFISRIMDALDGCSTVNHAKYFVGGASRGAYMPYFLMQRPSTRNRIAGAAVNAGLLYCQAGDTACESGRSDAVLHASSARIIHFHGTDDTLVEPPPIAAYHSPVDWSVDWRVFWPMKLWAAQHGCFGSATGPPDNGILKETYQANGHVARVYDLTGNGAACARYQLILVENGGHVIGNQEPRIWAFLMNEAFDQRQGSSTTVGLGSYRKKLHKGRVLTVTGTTNADGSTLDLICARGRKPARVLATTKAVDGGFALHRRLRKTGRFSCVVTIPGTPATSGPFRVRVR